MYHQCKILVNTLWGVVCTFKINKCKESMQVSNLIACQVAIATN